MKKIVYIFAAAALLLMPSCQQFEPEIFDESAAERANSFLADIRETLVAEQYGWTLDYYPKKDFAGTAYALKFTSQKVTAIHESNPSVSETSTYALKYDNASVLSFDTYNSILHKYATPSDREYQAKGGDFEFEIRGFNRETKEIKLVGKRSRNTCTLRPLKKEGKGYLEDVNAFKKAMKYPAGKATIDGVEYEAYLNSGNRSMSIGPKGASSDSTLTVRYVLTGNSLRFMRPFSLGDKEFSEWTYDAANEAFSEGGVTFQKFLPSGYLTYEQFLGNFTLSYGSGRGKFTVTLVENEKDNSFKMEGLSNFFQPVIGYDGGRGRLTWEKQTIGGSGSLEYILAPWDTNAGYLTWLDGVGVVGTAVDSSVNDFVIEFVDNGVWVDYKASGWLVWSMNGSSSAGGVSSWPMATGSYQLPGDITLTKIVE